MMSDHADLINDLWLDKAKKNPPIYIRIIWCIYFRCFNYTSFRLRKVVPNFTCYFSAHVPITKKSIDIYLYIYLTDRNSPCRVEDSLADFFFCIFPLFTNLDYSAVNAIHLVRLFCCVHRCLHFKTGFYCSRCFYLRRCYFHRYIRS